MSSQETLPEEILFEIFSYLPTVEFLKSCSLNKTLSNLCHSSENIWKKHVETPNNSKLENPTVQFSWKEYFKTNYLFENQFFKKSPSFKEITHFKLPKRKRHTSHAVNHKLYFIGGNVDVPSDDLIIELDFKNDSIQFIQTKGLSNLERHCSELYNEDIYIFCGLFKKKLNDVWKFNTGSL
jgi:hypothetical protein